MLEKVRGITDIQVPPLLGQPTIRIDIDRQRAARYGLSPGDINATIQAAVGGQAAGDLYENGSDRHFPMKVRLAPRSTATTWRRCAASPSARRVPPAASSRCRWPRSPRSACRAAPSTSIASSRSASSRSSSRCAAATSAARCSRRSRRSPRRSQLPGGYRLDWAGDFANFQNAIDRLSIAVPIAIALILLLLYVSFGSLTDTLLAGSAIPMALIGGILGLFLADMSFSISAAIGFVALFGIAAMNGIMVVGCFNRLIDAGLEREAALRRDLRASRCGRC